MNQPTVCFVGAGPGDPGLLTVRGLERLQSADAVVYDHLVPKTILRHARTDAELIDLGAAGPNPTAREAIGYLLAEKAREGKLVVRLQAGDPFVFSRGGEEAHYLRQQGVPFEIVPGVPTGVAVPAYAGVPVSYAESGDTITFVRGCEDENRSVPDIDWRGLAALDGTVVCHASAYQLPRLLEALLTAGWAPDTPALLVYNGTLPSQSTAAATLGDLGTMLSDAPKRATAVLIVGRVAALRSELRWFDVRPLSQRRVLVTRPRDQAAELSNRLAALGAEPIEVPVIRIVPPDDLAPLMKAAAAPDVYECIVFTSANAVDAFMGAFLGAHADVRMLKGPRLCAIGPGTAARLSRYGVRADIVPDEFRAEAVAAAIAAVALVQGLRVLLPRADIGREVVADELRRAGALVDDVVAYRTIISETLPEDDPDVYRMLLDGEIDVVTFTSASAVKGFAAIYGEEQVADLLRQTLVAVIGPTTADAARRAGIDVAIQPSSYTVPALVDAIAEHFRRR